MHGLYNLNQFSQLISRGPDRDTLISILNPHFCSSLLPILAFWLYMLSIVFPCSSTIYLYPSLPCCSFGRLMSLSSKACTADCEACNEHGLIRQNLPVRTSLVSCVGIWMSFSWGAVSPLSHRGVGTHELGFCGSFVVHQYLSVQLDLGYLVSQFRIQQYRQCH